MTSSRAANQPNKHSIFAQASRPHQPSSQPRPCPAHHNLAHQPSTPVMRHHISRTRACPESSLPQRLTRSVVIATDRTHAWIGLLGLQDDALRPARTDHQDVPRCIIRPALNFNAAKHGTKPTRTGNPTRRTILALISFLLRLPLAAVGPLHRSQSLFLLLGGSLHLGQGARTRPSMASVEETLCAGFHGIPS